jgi:hypothetical protein
MLKNLNLLLTVALVVSIISGCATTTQGNEFISETSRIENLLKKNSDKKDVFYAVGQPVYVRQDGDNSIWTVMRTDERLSAASFIPFANILTTGAVYKTNINEFIFDKSNVLKAVKKEDFEVTTNITDFHGWYNDKVKSQINDDVEKIRDEMKKFNLPFDEKSLRAILFNDKAIRHHQSLSDSKAKK